MKPVEQAGHCKETQETLALLEVLALTNENVEKGKVRPVDEAFRRIRERAPGRFYENARRI